jgi:transcriptional regulator with XRE-family HTH domain
MPGGIPQRLTERHRVAAWLLASGLTRREVARQVGLHPCSVSHLRQARSFRELVEAFQREVRGRVIASTVQELVGAEPVRRRKVHGEASPAFVRGPSGGCHE